MKKRFIFAVPDFVVGCSQFKIMSLLPTTSTKRRQTEGVRYSKRIKRIEQIKYKLDFFSTRANYRDLIQAIVDYFPIDQWLIFRRVNKNFKQQIDKLRGKYAGTKIKRFLMQEYSIPESLIELVESQGGVFSGSTILECIYGKRLDKIGPYKWSNPQSDIDVFIPFSAVDTMHQWIRFHQDSLWESGWLTQEELLESPDNTDDYGRLRLGPEARFTVGNYLPKSKENHRKLQIIYMNSSITVKEHIIQGFDLSVVKNWFDGKRLYIGHQNDIVTRTTVCTLNRWEKEEIISKGALKRISKYYHKGFRCRNLRIDKSSTVYEEQKVRTRRYYLDNRLFYCLMDPHLWSVMLPKWLSNIGIIRELLNIYNLRRRYGLARCETGKGLLKKFIKYCNEQLGFEYPENYMRVLLAANTETIEDYEEDDLLNSYTQQL